MSASFNDYKYNLSKVTATCIDTTVTGNPYLWIAFAQKNGVCLLKKVSAFNPLQVYYTVQVPASAINALVVVNGFIFVAVTHATYFLFAYSVTNPLTTFSTINKPAGVTESPIGLTTDGSAFVYALTPGIITATVANIIQITGANVFSATIPLTGITNVSCITIDASNNLWCSTNESPASLIRVWNTGVWNIETTVLS
jgi:hypothetical protein